MQVDLPRDIVGRFRSALRAAGRREVGGVLMAEQIAQGHFRLADFSLDSQTGGLAHFVRTPELHAEALDSFFSRTGADFTRFNYLGEWHSHPSFPAVPSSEDCRSMVSLVEREQGIPFAVLVILRLRLWTMLECSASLFVRGEGIQTAALRYVD